MLKYFVLAALLYLTDFSFCQTQTGSFSIDALVFDSLKNEKIPFVSIYKSRDHKGTLSNFSGDFTLTNISQGDTIICSYIGYEQTLFIADKEKHYDTIYLRRASQLIDEVIVMADNSILYQLVSDARKTSNSIEQNVKTYFELETFNNQTQLELFQGYYNGTLKGYDLSGLGMKNARFALAPISNRIFASTETSKAMYMHSLMTSTDYFPKSPLDMNKSQLRKMYQLSLSNKFKDENQKTIYVINYEAIREKKSHFNGKIWIDSMTNQIMKVKLQISDAKVHPFRSIWPFHELEKVNIDLTKSFSEINGEMYVKSIDFNYALNYVSENDSVLQVNTRAVLYAYSYNDLFTLPFFEFAKTSNADYRQIQMLPNNTSFWECSDEFKLENNEAKRIKFIKDSSTIKSYDLLNTDAYFKKNFFENPYITWNGKRVLIKGISEDSASYYQKEGVISVQRYRLAVQLFMDVTKLCDSIQVITKTIFDPYMSFYQFPESKESQAFINIYFDLMEIERRKLAASLLQCDNDLEMMKQTYKEAKNQAESMSEIYFKEVQRGTNKAKLLKWNDVVMKALNIDNMALFGVEI